MMIDFFQKLFDTSDFSARWNCGRWDAGVGWLHIVCDVVTFGAFLAVPITLLWLVRKRKEIVFPRVVWLFASLIFVCGLVHLVEAIIFWYPIYRFSGLLKLITALVSWVTVLAFIRISPAVLKVPGTMTLNHKLRQEVISRQRAEERLTAILDSMSDGVMVSDMEGNLELVNPAANSIFGFRPEDEQYDDRKTRYSLFIDNGKTELVGDDLPLRSACLGRTLNNTEILIRCPSRQVEETIRLSTRPIMAGEQKPEGAVAVFRDVSELKRIEHDRDHQLRVLEQTTASAARVTEAMQLDLWGNRHLMRTIATEFDCSQVLLATCKDAEKVNLRCLEIGPDEETSKQQKFDAHHFFETVPHQRLVNHALVVDRLDIQELQLEHVAIGGLLLNGDVRGAVMVCGREAKFTEDDLLLLHNISRWISAAIFNEELVAEEQLARREVEAKLATSRQQLDRLSRAQAVGEMTAGIAHELNQPLTALVNFTDAAHTLASGTVDLSVQNDLQQLTRKCNEQAVRAAEVLRSVRNLVRQEPTQFSNVNLLDLITDTVELLRGELHQQKVTVGLEAVDEDIVFQADRIQLQQVFVNLIRNAIVSFSSKGQRNIQIAARISRGYVLIDVADAGMGFNENEIEHLFDAFFTTRTSGLGLGLKICRSIIELHGGKIEARNNSNGGATFTIEIPMHEIQQEVSR